MILDEGHRSDDIDEPPFVYDLCNHDSGEEHGRVPHILQLGLFVQPAPADCVLDVMARPRDGVLVLDLGSDQEAPVVPANDA